MPKYRRSAVPLLGLVPLDETSPAASNSPPIPQSADSISLEHLQNSTLVTSRHSRSYSRSGSAVGRSRRKRMAIDKKQVAVEAPKFQGYHPEVFRWTLRETQTPMMKGRHGNNRTANKPPLYFLEDRVQFESPMMNSYVHECDPNIEYTNVADGFFSLEKEETEESGTPLERVMKANDKLHASVRAHLDAIQELKADLDLNYEVVQETGRLAYKDEKSDSSDEDDDYTYNSAGQGREVRKHDEGMVLMKNLRRHYGMSASCDPRELEARKRLEGIVEDVHGIIETLDDELGEESLSGKRTLNQETSRAKQAVKTLSSLTTFFRHALRETPNPLLSQVYESCWKAAMLVYEASVTRGQACADHVDSLLQLVDLDDHSGQQAFATSKQEMMETVARKVELDAHKKSLVTLQKDMKVLKSENIFLVKRITDMQKKFTLREQERQIKAQEAEARKAAKPFTKVTSKSGKGGTKGTGSGKGEQSQEENENALSLARRNVQFRTLDTASLELAKDEIPVIIEMAMSCTDPDQYLGLEMSDAHAQAHAQTKQSQEAATTSNDIMGSGRDLLMLSKWVLLLKAQEHGFVRGYKRCKSVMEMADFLSHCYLLKFSERAKADRELGWLCRQLRDCPKPRDNKAPALSIQFARFIGLAKPVLPLSALDVCLFVYGRGCDDKRSDTLMKLALETLYNGAGRNEFRILYSLRTGYPEEDERLRTRTEAEELHKRRRLICLQSAMKIINDARKQFNYEVSSLNIAEHHIEKSVVLADGSSIAAQERRLLLLVHRVFLAVNRTRVSEFRRLFRRFDPRESLRCGVCEEDTVAIVELFDCGLSNNTIDYVKFGGILKPVSLFVPEDVLMGAAVAMWNNERSLAHGIALRTYETDDFKQRIFTLAEFTTMLQRKDSSISQRDAAIYFQECLDMTQEPFMTRESFMTLVKARSLFMPRPKHQKDHH